MVIQLLWLGTLFSLAVHCAHCCVAHYSPRCALQTQLNVSWPMLTVEHAVLCWHTSMNLPCRPCILHGPVLAVHSPCASTDQYACLQLTDGRSCMVKVYRKSLSPPFEGCQGQCIESPVSCICASCLAFTIDTMRELPTITHFPMLMVQFATSFGQLRMVHAFARDGAHIHVSCLVVDLHAACL